MARWLLTTAASVDVEALRAHLARRTIDVTIEEPSVPLGEDEQVVAVEGAEDLPARLRDDDLVRHVHPDSPIMLYGTPPRPPEG